MSLTDYYTCYMRLTNSQAFGSTYRYHVNDFDRFRTKSIDKNEKRGHGIPPMSALMYMYDNLGPLPSHLRNATQMAFRW